MPANERRRRPRTSQLNRTCGRAALAIAVIVGIAACGDGNEDASDRAEAAVASIDFPINMVYDEFADDGKVTRWAVSADAPDQWTAEILSSDAPGMDAHYRVIRNGEKRTTIEPNVLDLSDYFTPEEIKMWTDRLGVNGPYLVQDLVEEGVLVPGDDETVEILAPDERDLIPNLLLGPIMHPMDLTDVRDIKHNGRPAFEVPLTEDTRMVFDAAGLPVALEDKINGKWVAFTTIVEFSHGQ